MPTRLLLLLPLLGIALAASAAPPPAPDQLGPYAVGRTTYRIFDADRDDRRLLLDVWYPVDAEDAVGEPSRYDLLILGLDSAVAIQDARVSDDQMFPLVVFSHGNGGVRFQSFFLAEILASHGFIVAAPDHTGNTLLEFLASPPSQDDILQSGLDRPRDISFVITTLLERNFTAGDDFYLRIDPFRIGVSGHSFGGFTSLAMAAGFGGEAAEVFGIPVPDDFEPIPPDPRVRAIAPIAPASTPFSDDDLAGIDVPTLIVGGTVDETTPLDPEVVRPYQLIDARPLYRVDVIDAGHFSFTNICDLIQVLLDSGLALEAIADLIGGAFDEGCAPELIPIGEAQRITNLFTVAFMKRHLAHDVRYQSFLTPRFARIEEPDAILMRAPVPLPPFLLQILSMLFAALAG